VKKDENTQQQNISKTAGQKSWADLMLESWQKPVEDFGHPRSNPEELKKD
jgi:hypothetical protein